MVKMGRFEYSEKELKRQFAAATKRGKEAMGREPQARSGTYDRATNRLITELKNGATFIISCDLIQGVLGADPDLIAEVELGPRGSALHWEMLDQDFSVAGLFGTKAWMAELGRLSGRTSEAKAAASRTKAATE